MFICKNIIKKYGHETVLNNFSYCFPQNGFVLLYGKSGCGKTTLLNILAGIIDYDSGTVCFNNRNYTRKLTNSCLSDCIAYITQDPHIIDYLTVKENLELCSMYNEKISNLLIQFGLEERSSHYPDTLSGGEKQRLAMIQALLMDKSIIILDEPTSALDKKNKIAIFELLKHLGEERLIVCSSHDQVAKQYADEIIDFYHPQEYKESSKECSMPILTFRSDKKRKLSPYFSKWYSYDRKKSKSKIMLLIIITLSIMSMCICDLPGYKYASNIEHSYKINQFKVSCTEINQPLLDSLKQEKSVLEVNLSYALSVPIEVNEETSMIISEYDLLADTLPFAKEAFPFSENVKYGTYFTREDQIMLSYEQALPMGNPESLIGQKMQLNLYDATYDLEIIGIFDTFTEFEKQYFKASGITINEAGNYFLNGNFTQRYCNNNEFFMYGHRSYIVYCTSFASMNDIFQKYSIQDNRGAFVYADIDGQIKNLFESLFYITSPFVIITIIAAALFYYQSQKIEFAYNKHIFGVYDYLGYSLKDIRRCFIFGNIRELLWIVMKSVLITIPLMFFVNCLNSKFFFIPFQIFSYNFVLILVLDLFICLIGIVMALINMREIRKHGWYQTLIQQRDLI